MSRNYDHTTVPAFNSLGSSRLIRQEFDAVEAGFNGVEAEIDLKAPIASPTFTGTVTLPSTTSIGNVSATEISYLDGVTSAIQTQLTAEVNARISAVSAEELARISGDSDLETRKADISGETYTGTHDFTGASVTVPTLTYGVSGNFAASVEYVNQSSFQSALPGQTGPSGRVLTTDGTTASWQPFPHFLFLSQGII